MPIKPENREPHSVRRGCKPSDPYARLLARVAANGECIEFQGKLRNGYGAIFVDGRVEYAHRLAYMRAIGPIPGGTEICHRCDNRKCVRPEHLFAGTRSDNMRDASAKRRLRQQVRPESCRGERNPAAKLSVASVAEIRRCLANGERQQPIANRYGVSLATVSNIATGRTWANAD